MSKIIRINYKVDLKKILLTEHPKYFTEIVAKRTAKGLAVSRYVNKRWLHPKQTGVHFIIAKKGLQTVIISKDHINILGHGNYEQVLLAMYRNGWVDKDITNRKIEYKSISGRFSFGHHVHLAHLNKELLRLGIKSFYNPEIFSALSFKLGDYTYQVFPTGTVLFSGVKDPKNINVPEKKFRNLIFNNKRNTFANIPSKINLQFGAPAMKTNLAQRYPLATSWNQTPKPGYYVRPGTNKHPRLYKHRKIEKHPQTGELINYGMINLRGVAPKVVRAYKNVGVPIPKGTLNAFRSQGINLSKLKIADKKENKRAPSWNSKKNGYYVRPGPGKLPVWAKIPSSLASGRKTVIKKYVDAGRNIPKTVREIFKITNVTAHPNGPHHNVQMGVNGYLHINGQQAKRFKIKNLISIARNLNIPEVNEKTKRENIINFIKRESGSNFAKRNFNVKLNGKEYKFLLNGKLQITKGQKRTTRNWNTFPNKNALAKAFLGNTMYKNYKAIPMKNKYNSLLSMKYKQNNNLNNFASQLEANLLKPNIKGINYEEM
jgi:uncharacterized protein YcgL (UPF0745 family)